MLRALQPLTRTTFLIWQAGLFVPDAHRVTMALAGGGARAPQLDFSYFPRLQLIGVTATPPRRAA